jgi:hypothetical protein
MCRQPQLHNLGEAIADVQFVITLALEKECGLYLGNQIHICSRAHVCSYNMHTTALAHKEQCLPETVGECGDPEPPRYKAQQMDARRPTLTGTTTMMRNLLLDL